MIRQAVPGLISAVLLVLAFPPFNLWFCAWFAFVPLIRACGSATCPRPFWCGYACGLVFWMGTIYWLGHVTVAGTIALCAYLALYLGLFSRVLAFSALRKIPAAARICFIAALWVCLEYLRSYLLTGFPWALLGYSQYLNLPVLQIADITGAWGVSFLVMMANAAAAEALQRRSVKPAAVCALVLAGVCGYGFWRIHQQEAAQAGGGECCRVAVIQANIPQQLKWQPAARSFILERYLSLSRQAAAGKPDLIAWPEAALPTLVEDDLSTAAVRELVERSATALVFGAVTVEGDAYFNSALLYQPGQADQQYRKVHLVPFGEYIPLRRALPFLETIVPIGDVSPGKEYTLLRLSGKNRQPAAFSVLICFEDVFPELSRRFVLAGAQFLLNITNDAWYERTAASSQHLQASVLRAVENRIWVCRSANTGISAFIRPDGRQAALVRGPGGEQIFVEGTLEYCLPLRRGAVTGYTRWGDVFVLLCMLSVLVVAGYCRPVVKKA